MRAPRREKACGCLVFPFHLRAHMVRGNWYVSIPEELIFSTGEVLFSEAKPTFE